MLYFYIDSEDIQEIYERTMDTLKKALFGVAGDVIETGQCKFCFHVLISSIALHPHCDIKSFRKIFLKSLKFGKKKYART